jgi:hypothetical protein
MRILVSLVVIFLIVQDVLGQQSIFGLHAVLGANASQISGDQLAGFDKVGLHGGLRGTVALTEKAGLSVELLYSVRGSRPDIFNDIADPEINITLRYLDLPVYLTYTDWYDEEHGYYKAFAAAGLSYGRLIESSTFDHFNTGDADIDLLAKEFNENDFSWLFGFGFRLSEHVMISARYTRSILYLLNARKKNLNAHSLLPYFLTFRGEYIF